MESFKKFILENIELEEKSKTDAVDKKELKGKFKDRDDKDIDNDGDVDDSDEYLHKRRKAISKAIAKESVELEEAKLMSAADVANVVAKRLGNQKNADRYDQIKTIKGVLNASPQKRLATDREFIDDVLDILYDKHNIREETQEDKNKRSVDAHMFKQAAKKKAGIPVRRPGESLAAYVTRKAKAEAKMKKESVELDEDVRKMSHSRLKFHMNNKSVPHGSHSWDEMKSERDRRLKTGEGEAYKKAKSSMSEAEELDEAKLAAHIVRGDTYVGVPDRVVARAKDKVKKMNLTKASEQQKAMNKALSDMGGELTIGGKYVREEVELDEVSDKKLDAYRQKAFADQPSGDDGSEKYRKRKFGRDLAFAKQTGRAKVRATKEEVELDEAKKATDYDSYEDYAKANKAKGVQVIPRTLWNNLMKDKMKESTDLDEAPQPKWKAKVGNKTYTVTARNTFEANKKAADLARKEGNKGVPQGKIEKINEDTNAMVRIGQKMLALAPKEKNDMISNAYANLGDALTRYDTPFGPKSVKDLEKTTGLKQRIIMDLMRRVNK